MTEPTPIVIPLINPNEPGAQLAALFVSPGQHVARGDRLCTLETTKSTVELIAESDGFVVGLTFTAGQAVQAGEILAYLANSPDWLPPVQLVNLGEQVTLHNPHLRISQPALLLAQQHNLDLSDLGDNVFITEKHIQAMIDHLAAQELDLPLGQFEPGSIIIYGGGGHGKALIDLVRVLSAYPIAGIVDDGLPAGSSIMGTQVLGGSGILEKLLKVQVHMAANAVGGIGDINSRIKVFDILASAGFTCPSLVHPTAFVEASAALNGGVQVMPHAYVGSDARVGFGAIINTGAIVSHDCVVGDYANLSPGAILAGEVNVGNAALIGMGVTVNLRVSVGSRARIGNGATVKQDVPEGGIVRAGSVWPE